MTEIEEAGIVRISGLSVSKEERLLDFLKERSIRWCGVEFAGAARSGNVSVAARELTKEYLCSLSQAGFTFEMR